jgi:hypothetical protein
VTAERKNTKGAVSSTASDTTGTGTLQQTVFTPGAWPNAYHPFNFWTNFFRTNASGSGTTPYDTHNLEEFRGGIKINWKEIQKTSNPAEYDWALIDDALTEAATRGVRLTLAFRAFVPDLGNVCPSFITAGMGTTFANGDFVPTWGNTSVRTYWRNFILAAGTRYNSDQRVAAVYGGYGQFGERILTVVGPIDYTVETPTAEVAAAWDNDFLDAFPDKPFYLATGGVEGRDSWNNLLRTVPRVGWRGNVHGQDTEFRNIYANSTGAGRLGLREKYQTAPSVQEFYSPIDEAGLLQASSDTSHPVAGLILSIAAHSEVNIPAPGYSTMSANSKSYVDLIAQSIGYRLRIAGVQIPTQVGQNTATPITVAWELSGAVRIFVNYTVKWRLYSGASMVAESVSSLDLRTLQPLQVGNPVSIQENVTFNAAPGTYTLGVMITPPAGDPTANLKLAHATEETGTWYSFGTITVVSNTSSQSSAEAATGTDTLSIVRNVTQAETGTGVDNASVSAAGTQGETGSGLDALAAVRAASPADAVSGTDALSTLISALVAESASATENITTQSSGGGVVTNWNISVGAGYTDVSPKQVVRTSEAGGGRLYVFAANCEAYPCDQTSQTLRAYRANVVGLPVSFTRPDAAHEPGGIAGWAVAIDGSDVVHVVWSERTSNGATTASIKYRKYFTATDLWDTTTETIAATGTDGIGQGVQDVAVALDVNGIPHVVYLKGMGTARRMYYNHRIGGTWASETSVDNTVTYTGNQRAWHPNLVFDTNNGRVFTWERGSFNGDTDGTIFVRTRSDAGSWGSAVDLSTGNGGARVIIDQSTSMVVSSDNRYHLVFITTNDYWRYCYSDNLGVNWTFNNPGGGSYVSHNPSLGYNGSTLRIFGHGVPVAPPDGYAGNVYAFSGNGGAGAWSSATLLATGQYDASVNTRWAQYFHSYPATTDIAYWDYNYPNNLFVGSEVTTVNNSSAAVGENPTGTETVSGVRTSLVADTATGLDTILSTLSSVVGEVGTVADSLASMLSGFATDTLASVDALIASFLRTATDTGSGTDVVSAVRSSTQADTASGTDSVTSALYVVVTDAAGGLDAVAAALNGVVADAATSVDALATAFPGGGTASTGDTGVGSDTLGLLIQSWVEDTFAGTEGLLVQYIISVADSAVFLDNLGGLRAVIVNDNSASSDAILGARIVLSSEALGGVESVAAIFTASVADLANGIDAHTGYIGIVVNEIGASLDVVTGSPQNVEAEGTPLTGNLRRATVGGLRLTILTGQKRKTSYE